MALADGLWSRTGRGTAPRHRKGHGYRGLHQGAVRIRHRSSRPERLREPLCDLPSTRAATAGCRSHHHGCGRAARTADRLEWYAADFVPPFTTSLPSLCIPRLPGRRLTGCAIAETEPADSEPPGVLFRQARPARTPYSARRCRSGSTQFQHRAALVLTADLLIRAGSRNA